MDEGNPERNWKVENNLIQGLSANPALSFLISIILNVIIAVSGVLPSALITTANIVFFGFKAGLIISIIGEAAGAIVSFILYRHGLNKFHIKLENRFLKKLKNTEGTEAVFLVIILRVLPFIPSGLVTLTAAFSQMRLLSFSIASTVGKIPSLFIEAYSAKQILDLSIEWQVGIFLFVTGIYIFYKLRKRNDQSD